MLESPTGADGQSPGESHFGGAERVPALAGSDRASEAPAVTSPKVSPPVLAKRLVVVTGAVHHRSGGAIHSYTPYEREVDAWAHLFGEVRILAPVSTEAPGASTSPFRAPNVSLIGVPPTGGEHLADKLRQAMAMPRLAVRLAGEIRRADAVHVRCPSNLGLLGVVLAPRLSEQVHAKYAGSWSPFPAEPWSSRLQRRLLTSRWWNGPVSAYGRRHEDPDWVAESFSAALSSTQLADRPPCRPRVDGEPLRVLFVGRLSVPKRVDAVLRAVAAARDASVDCRATIVGDGPERLALADLATHLGLARVVEFRGAMTTDEVLDAYRDHHVLALVSDSEGWPKALIEAMAFGLVVIGSDQGLVPRIVAGGRGFTVPPGDAAEVGDLLVRLAQDDCLRVKVGSEASSWAGGYTLERFADDLSHLLTSHWSAPRRRPLNRLPRFRRGTEPSQRRR